MTIKDSTDDRRTVIGVDPATYPLEIIKSDQRTVKLVKFLPSD